MSKRDKFINELHDKLCPCTYPKEDHHINFDKLTRYVALLVVEAELKMHDKLCQGIEPCRVFIDLTRQKEGMEKT